MLWIANEEMNYLQSNQEVLKDTKFSNVLLMILINMF